MSVSVGSWMKSPRSGVILPASLVKLPAECEVDPLQRLARGPPLVIVGQAKVPALVDPLHGLRPKQDPVSRRRLGECPLHVPSRHVGIVAPTRVR